MGPLRLSPAVSVALSMPGQSQSLQKTRRVILTPGRMEGILRIHQTLLDLTRQLQTVLPCCGKPIEDQAADLGSGAGSAFIRVYLRPSLRLGALR